jgi:sterol desaturase/sphingolipid hydroxylase (fatty acid hydroxylase superfamily)
MHHTWTATDILTLLSPAHVMHHSSQHYNLSTALRQSWTGVAVGTWTPWYQFWIHTETIHRMPAWFEYLFNTPSHHRVHHGSNPASLREAVGVVFGPPGWRADGRGSTATNLRARMSLGQGSPASLKS